MKKKENRGNRFTLPSFIYAATVIVTNRKPLTDTEYLKRFARTMINVIGMEKEGDAVVTTLPSEIFGVESYSLNQPLKTSIQSIDTWPEKFKEGAFVMIIHSCKEFSLEKIGEVIREFFPKSRTVIASFIDRTYREEEEQMPLLLTP